MINGNKDDYDDEEDEYVDEDEISNDGRVYESGFYGENQDKEYISGINYLPKKRQGQELQL